MKPLLIALGLSLITLTARAELPTHEFQLDNGLDVLIREDHRAPVITVMVWFKAGSIDEAPYETGLAHVLEHMMFKGSKRLDAGEFSRTVARFGGSDNAFTSHDFTAYFQQYEASRLPLALELEAERLKNLEIKDEAFHRELQVVMEERRQRTDDKPTALAWEKFQAVARAGTGYAHPIIGWRDQLAQLQPEQARNWYRRFYVPGNATLVIAGDVTLEQARPLVKRFFADWAEGDTPPRPETTLNPPPGERRMTLRLPVRVPALYMSYNVPSLSTAGYEKAFYALTMLGGVLDGGISARMESNLVRGQRLAAGLGAGYNGMQRGNGTFTITATPNPDVSLDELETAIRAEIAKIAEKPPSAAEMDRVRAGVLASQVYQRDSVMGQAMELGTLSVLGLDWRLARQFDENLEAVTPEQVQQAARDWLVADRSAVAHVIPEGEE